MGGQAGGGGIGQAAPRHPHTRRGTGGRPARGPCTPSHLHPTSIPRGCPDPAQPAWLALVRLRSPLPSLLTLCPAAGGRPKPRAPPHHPSPCGRPRSPWPCWPWWPAAPPSRPSRAPSTARPSAAASSARPATSSWTTRAATLSPLAGTVSGGWGGLVGGGGRGGRRAAHHDHQAPPPPVAGGGGGRGPCRRPQGPKALLATPLGWRRLNVRFPSAAGPLRVPVADARRARPWWAGWLGDCGPSEPLHPPSPPLRGA